MGHSASRLDGGGLDLGEGADDLFGLRRYRRYARSAACGIATGPDVTGVDPVSDGRWHYGWARRWSVAAVLFLVFCSAYIDRQIISLLLPSLKSAFALSDGQLGIIQGFAFAIIYVLAALPLGRLVDQRNRRNLLAVGILVWSVATIASAFADSFAHLVMARVFVGIGEACIAPACVSLVGDYFPSRERGRANGIVQTGAAVGSAAAFTIGGLLLQRYAGGNSLPFLPDDFAGWRIVLLLAGMPGLFVAMLLLIAVREPARLRSQNYEASRPTAILPFIRTRGSTFALFVAIFALLQLSGFGAASWGPSLLIRIYGMGPAQAGIVFGTIVLAFSVMGLLGNGFLSDWLVRRRPADGRILIPLVFMPIEIGCWLTISQTSDITVVIAALAVSAVSVSMNISGAYTALQEIVPREMCGRAVAIYLFVTNLVGLGCGPLAIGLITDRVFDDEMRLQASMSIVAVTATGLALILMLILVPRYRAARLAMIAEDKAALPVALAAEPVPDRC